MPTRQPSQAPSRRTHQSQEREKVRHHHHPETRRPRHHYEHAQVASASAVFIQQTARAAQTSEIQTGVPASVTIAQAIVESGWGRYHMGSANNYFGIKGASAHGSVLERTREFFHGEWVTIKARFRAYASMADSFIDHGLMLKHNQIYARGFRDYERTGNADLFAEHLQRAGYATDPHYASTLVRLMRRFDLHRFDGRQPNGNR